MLHSFVIASASRQMQTSRIQQSAGTHLWVTPTAVLSRCLPRGCHRVPDCAGEEKKELLCTSCFVAYPIVFEYKGPVCWECQEKSQHMFMNLTQFYRVEFKEKQQ